MPNIPSFVTAPGQLPGSGPAPRMGGEGVSAVAYETIKQGDRLADAANVFTEKYVQAKLQVDTADQTSSLSRQLSEAQDQASKIPDRMKATEHYDAATSKIYQDYENAGGNPLVRAAVSTRFTQERDLRRRDTQTTSFQLESQTQRGKLVEQLDVWGKDAASSSDPRQRDLMIQNGMDAIDGRVAGGWMNPEAGAKAKIDFQSSVYSGIIKAAMASDPGAGVAAFKAYSKHLSAHDEAILKTDVASAEKGIVINNGAAGLVGAGPGSITGVVEPLLAQFPDLKGRITSTDRTPQQNAAAGGAKDSAHLHGDKAMDISLAGMPDDQKQQIIAAALANPNIKGFGYYPATDSIHIDTAHAVRTAWGGDQKSGSVGQGWPSWMTDKVKEWQGGKATGDGYAQYQARALGRIADHVANGPGSLDVRLAQAQKASAILSTQTAAVTAERKVIEDDFATAINNISSKQGMYTPGTFQSLADRLEASGDRSKAAIYRDFANHEDEIKNFWSLPPAQQLEWARKMPGEAGTFMRANLVELTKARTEAMRAGEEAEKLARMAMAQKDDPRAVAKTYEDAIRQFHMANRPERAKRLEEDFSAYGKAHDFAKQSPTAMDEIKRAIDAATNNGGEQGRHALALQKYFSQMSEANQTLAKTDPLSWFVNTSGGQMAPLNEKVMADPALLEAALANRGQLAVAAQTKFYEGAMVQPTMQKFGPLSGHEPEMIKKGLESAKLQDQQGATARIATALPDNMIGPFAKQVAGDMFGNALAVAAWNYKSKDPAVFILGDKILEGANMRKSAGPEAKNMVAPGSPDVRATFETTLGDSRRGFNQDPQTIAMMDDAAVSLYVSMKFGKGDMSVYDDTTMKKAITAIYGQRFNGARGDVLLPSGVDERGFRNGIANITDSDVPPFKDSLGRTLTANMVKTESRLITTGDGLYKVQIPGDNKGRMLDIPLPNGMPWTINIRELNARGNSPGVNSRQAPLRVIGDGQ